MSVADSVNDPVVTSVAVEAVTGIAEVVGIAEEVGISDRVNTLAKSARFYPGLIHITLAGHWKRGITRRAQGPGLKVNRMKNREADNSCSMIGRRDI